MRARESYVEQRKLRVRLAARDGRKELRLTTMAEAPNYRAPALEKGLDILELIARETNPLSLSEISDRLGRSKSEIFRMVLVLEERGYISRAGTGDRYQITNRLFMLGMTQPPVRTLLEASLPQMHRVAEETWQSCHLVVATGDEIVVIARVDSPGDIGYSVRIGHRRPITQSASGAVLFAFQPKDVQDRWLERLFRRGDADRKEFLSRVEGVRRLGYAQSVSDRVGAVVDLSVPLMNDGQAIATMAVPFVDQRPVVAPIEQTITILGDAAAQVSAALRFGPSMVITPGVEAPHGRIERSGRGRRPAKP